MIILSKSICYTFFNLDLSWGFGGEVTKLSYRWLSKLEGFDRLRYDFWDIVDTISELAKPYKMIDFVFASFPWLIRGRGLSNH